MTILAFKSFKILNFTELFWNSKAFWKTTQATEKYFTYLKLFPKNLTEIKKALKSFHNENKKLKNSWKLKKSTIIYFLKEQHPCSLFYYQSFLH